MFVQFNTCTGIKILFPAPSLTLFLLLDLWVYNSVLRWDICHPTFTPFESISNSDTCITSIVVAGLGSSLLAPQVLRLTPSPPPQGIFREVRTCSPV
jgi:hypothetical protein